MTLTLYTMYKRKTKDDLDCGITIAMLVFGGKWKPCILSILEEGRARPSEIHKRIPTATPRVLDMQLSEMHELGLVARNSSRSFPLVSEYYLTDLRKSILPIVHQLDAWGTFYKDQLKEKLAEVA